MRTINTSGVRETYIRALLYGPSGAGKTYSIRTLPAERTLVLLVEPKHLPLLGHDVDAVPIEGWDDLRSTFGEIKAGMEAGELVDNDRKKDILVVDSLSELNELCKRHIVNKDRPDLLQRQGKKDVGGIYSEQLDQPGWGLLATRIDSFVSACCHLPCHVVFTCLEQWTEDKEAGGIFITPALNGKLALQIAHHFDEVYRLEIHDVEGKPARYFRTQRTSKIIAKGCERLRDLEPADWTAVMSSIFGSTEPKSTTKKGGSK